VKKPLPPFLTCMMGGVEGVSEMTSAFRLPFCTGVISGDGGTFKLEEGSGPKFKSQLREKFGPR
jgi:hypothetical protein